MTRLVQVAADLDAVDLGQVRLDVARRQPARIEREDLVVEALEAPLPLAHDQRLEAALPVPGRFDPHRSVLGRECLRGRTIAGVARAAGRLLVRLVAEMLGQLRRHRPLHQPLRQLGEHTARPDDLLFRPSPGEQLVDHLVRKTIANRVRDPERRSASRSLRSPSGLAPQPAGATGQLIGLGLGLRRHDAPFQSCLHRASDTPIVPLASAFPYPRERGASRPESGLCADMAVLAKLASTRKGKVDR